MTNLHEFVGLVGSVSYMLEKVVLLYGFWEPGMIQYHNKIVKWRIIS